MCPVRVSNNNRVLPANARASDVASRAIQEILPAQQARNLAAFRVQGYQALLYNRLTQGRRCSCQSSQKLLNTRLDQQGKARPGVINELLTGMTFDVSPYGSNTTFGIEEPIDNKVAPIAPDDKYQGVFDIVSKDFDKLPSHITGGEAFGDNGPLDVDFDIETLAGDFDAVSLGMTDAACAVCFGTGFVAGYSAFNAQRAVLTVSEVDLGSSTLELTEYPWTATSTSFAFNAVLPHGAIGLDVFRVLNGNRFLNANFTVDSDPVNSVTLIKKCDGRNHHIVVQFDKPTQWTHIEMQFILSDQSAYFEFPKLSKGSNTALLEQLEPFTVLMSPNVPSLQTEDIIVDSVFGKTLVVQNSNWWNTRNRDVLGWECTVRVIQPQELFSILPKRGRIMTKQPTSSMAIDNQVGNKRT